MKTTHHDLDNRFCWHPPDKKKGEVHDLIRRKFREFASGIVTLCPHGGETSVALTKLEEAMFWANAAVARWETAVFPEPVTEDNLDEKVEAHRETISAGHVQFDQSPKEIAYRALQTVANIGSGEAQRQALIALREIDGREEPDGR